MRADYKRDMNRNYMILPGKNLDTDSYQVRMLVGNAVPSLLKCRIQGLDGNFMVYYDITSRQSLVSVYENKKLCIDDLKLIFGGFVKVMEEMAEYLLNAGKLVIEPEYMYLNPEKKEILFCYLPGREKDVREQFRELTEYLLPRLDHEDEQAVMLGYGVYRRALEDSFHLEHVKEELYRVREGVAGAEPETVNKHGNMQMLKETWENAAAQNSDTDVFPGERETGKSGCQEHEEWKNGCRECDDNGQRRGQCSRNHPGEKRTSSSEVWKKVAACGAAAAIILGSIGAKLFGYLPAVRTEVLLGGVIAGMGAGMLLCMLVRKYRSSYGERKTPGGEKPVTSERHWDFRDNGLECEAAGQEKEYEEQKAYEAGAEKEESAARENNQRMKNRTAAKSFGETVVLSENPVEGPATLVSREPGELATIYLQEDMTVIGKLETAVDAVIDLPTVSRVHAKIRKKDGQYYLSDLNSRNGTSVNGKMLKAGEDYALQEEDQVDFAQARYVFLR